MKIAATFALIFVLAAVPVSAIDFLGVELCRGSTDTAVDIPIGSSLVLESVEIGDNGGLVMLLSARSGKVMNHVDDLMTGLTGRRGQGDGDSLEWTDGPLTGVAQRVAKKYAALAVASADDCTGTEPAPVPAPVPAPTAAPRPVDVENVMQTPDPVPAAAAAVVAASQSPEPETEPAAVPVAESETVPETAAAPESAAVAGAAAVAVTAAETESAPEPAAAAMPDFNLVGALSHEAADQPWVDVMGVVANHTETSYKLATFDLSFFAADGSLICVDTISVSVLKTGQERAFRDAVRCPGYSRDDVAETRLQFAGGL